MKNRCVYLLFVMLTGVLMSAEIQSGIETEDQWRFEATPYFWFLSIDGDTTMEGVTGDVDLKFDDLFDLFKPVGQLNVPSSSRFTDTQHPVPSKHSTLIRVLVRLEKMNSAPFSGISPSSLRAIAYRPLKLFRKSTGSTASTTFRF